MRAFWVVGLALGLALLLAGCGDSAPLPWMDDFSDPTSGWQTESDATAEVEYRDGVMRLRILSPNRLAWAFADQKLTDFRLTVDATQVAGPDDNAYGVLVRVQDPEHFYRFSISGDGYYRVDKYEDGTWEILGGDWAASKAIHTGPATNSLAVTCEGATMSFAVNGSRLIQVEDGAYRRGDIGLYAGTFFEPGVEIHFDNLRVDAP